MKKVAITYPDFFPGEAEAIAKLLDGGEFWRLHIRKPGADEASTRKLIESVDPKYYAKITLHDHFHLAAEYRLGGLHLNSRNPESLEGWNGLVSRSIHSVEEIDGVTEDYAFLSPVYPSVSKPGYKGDFSLENLEEHITERIFALGGVTPERMPELERHGFAGVAMLGSIWRRSVDMDAFKLQFITHPSTAMTMGEEAEEVLRGGGRWIQLRHKDAPSATLIREGEEVGRLCREYGATFIVDDHVELAGRLKADGVHLGKNDMPVAEARRILGPGKIIGATANEFADIERAWLDGADYIGLGPFRFTTTKERLSPILGLEGYSRVVGQCRAAGITLPIVAIGGIAEDDIPSILDAGPAGVAISSTILGASSPQEKTAQILEIINR